jgi:hypothetical protein
LLKKCYANVPHPDRLYEQRADVDHLAASAGLVVESFESFESFEYLSQYPNYLMFNGGLHFLGICYEKLIRRFDTLRFLRGWITVTLRKPDLAR